MAEFGPLFAKIRADLPKEAFQPQPVRGIVVLALTLSVIIGGSCWLVQAAPSWYLALPVALAIGCAYSILSFLGHETLHGSVFRAKWAQEIVGTLAFMLFGFTSTLWKVWHNKVHHTLTNIPDVDPDSYGTLERFKKIPGAKFLFKTSLGSGHWLSIFYFFYRMTYHGQIVLWTFSKKYPEEFKSLNRKRAIFETTLLFSLWIALGAWLGLRDALFVILIPMAVANCTIMSYIATNHFLRPLVEKYNPIEDSMSVSTWKWIDFFHLNFSHHIEHHYFPSMNWRYTPLVRNSLRRHAADRFLAPPHWRTVLWLYRTPRIYFDPETLGNPYTGKTVNIHEVEAELFKKTPNTGTPTSSGHGIHSPILH